MTSTPWCVTSAPRDSTSDMFPPPAAVPTGPGTGPRSSVPSVSVCVCTQYMCVCVLSSCLCDPLRKTTKRKNSLYPESFSAPSLSSPFPPVPPPPPRPAPRAQEPPETRGRGRTPRLLNQKLQLPQCPGASQSRPLTPDPSNLGIRGSELPPHVCTF